MRNALILLFIGVLQAHAIDTYSQKTRLSLNFSDTDLTKVLDKIEVESEFFFLYNEKLLNTDRKVSITANDQLINVILDSLFAGTDVKYTIFDRKIILAPDYLTEVTQPQQNKITGTVTGKDGTPIPGVNVVVTGTTQGVITDIAGKYSIEVPQGSKSLTFSFVGMESQEISIGTLTQINVIMAESAIGLEEVVVIGYGVQKKSDLTGSISSVKVKDLSLATTPTVLQMLEGRAAGLTANLYSAEPGGAVNLQVRGAASNRSPLIVIDGFPVTGFSDAMTGYYYGGDRDATLASINPNDIESVDILKDASATSIYGSRAAGGVILITTKRGKAGKVNVTLDANTGFQKMYNLPEMLDAVSFMNESNRATKEQFLYDNKIAPYGSEKWEDFAASYIPNHSQAKIDKFRNGASSGTDWLDNVTRIGTIQNYNLSVNGGTTSTKYLASLGYYDQKGVIQNNNYKKYIGRVNIDQNFGEKVKGGITLNISQIKNDNVPLGSRAVEYSGIIRSAIQFNPTIPIKDENGNYTLNDIVAALPNPVSLLEVIDKSRTERMLSTAFLSYQIIKGLNVKVTIGVDRNQSQAYSYMPTTTLYGAVSHGSASRNQTEKTDYLTNLIFNYNKTFAEKHVLAITAGNEYQKFNWEGFGASNSNFPYDGMIWNNLSLGSQERPDVKSYGGSSENQSYIGRLNYIYDNRYFLTANIRIDGSSNFSKNHQWGLFSGISLGWNIANESFMASTRNVINQLKLRVGYGQTGNDNIGTAFSDYYSTGANTIWGNSIITGITLGGLGNPDLKWETQTDINVGLDFGLFQNRISGSIEVFNRTISDILDNKTLMSYNQINSITYNIDAEKETYGIEASLNSINFITNEFEWTSNATFTYYRDRWKKRDPNWKPDIFTDPKAFFNEIWLVQSDGLIQPGDQVSYTTNPVPGTIKLKDIDGYLLDENGKRVLDDTGRPQRLGEPDGKIDNADFVKVGINIPYTIGLGNTLKYKNFDLNVYAYGMFNRWKTNNTLLSYAHDSYLLASNMNMMTNVLERWNSDNMTGTFSSSLQGKYGMGYGDFFLEKAWFIRVRNISLGYRFPASMINGIQNLRVYGDIQNPFLFTPYSGTDPESDNYTAAYPNQRSFSLGIQLTF